MQQLFWYPSVHPWWYELKIEIWKISTTGKIWDRYTWHPHTNHSNQSIPMERNVMDGKLFIGITGNYRLRTEIYIEKQKQKLKWNIIKIQKLTYYAWTNVKLTLLHPSIDVDIVLCRNSPVAMWYCAFAIKENTTHILNTVPVNKPFDKLKTEYFSTRTSVGIIIQCATYINIRPWPWINSKQILLLLKILV